jgi:hypothetical protein
MVIAWCVGAVVLALVACGEVRRPIGEECLRGEDCLSGVCSARECVAAPTLVTGAQPAPDETARIPPGDAGREADAPADAPAEGG